MIAAAQKAKVEVGAMVRIDSTVTAALMHEPSDSALLWDAVRLMTRLLRQAAALPGAPAMRAPDHRRMDLGNIARDEGCSEPGGEFSLDVFYQAPKRRGLRSVEGDDAGLFLRHQVHSPIGPR